MTLVIDDLPTRVSFTVGGTPEDEFVVPFAFFDDEDLLVYVDDELQTLTTDYTVVGAGTSEPDARTVTLVTPVSSCTVLIVRSITVERMTDLSESLPYDPVAINLDLDRIIAILQEQETDQTRSLRQPDSDEDDIAELPAAADRANLILGFDADGDPTMVAGDVDSVLVSAAVEPLLLSASETAFKQGLLLDKHGADKASAGTVNLDTSTGDLVDITGTTTITAITLAEGIEKTVRFTGILTLTHGASLVLPGAANITTAAGDFAVFRGYAAGVVRCVDYTKASGQAVVAPTPTVPGLVYISTTTVSGAAALDITAGLNSTYDVYEIDLRVAPATDDAILWMRISQDAGATFKAGASDYRYTGFTMDQSGSGAVDPDSAAASKIVMSGGIGNATAEHAVARVVITRVSETTYHFVRWELSGVTGTPTMYETRGTGLYAADGNAIDAIRFLMSTGNITGKAVLYGRRIS
jgi:hypothetical protein